MKDKAGVFPTSYHLPRGKSSNCQSVDFASSAVSDLNPLLPPLLQS